MKASYLLIEIKENMESFNINILEESLKKDNINSIAKQVSKYNINNYYEIINKNILEDEDFEISDRLIKNIKNEINLFFEGCSPESDTKFRKFIESICLYLSLIAKKPLHPIGMDFGENKTVKEKEENGKIVYYCDIKKELEEESEDYYTCKYCVCKIK